MKIIISPAKKMAENVELFETTSMPKYLSQAKTLLNHLQKLTYDELKALWKCNDAIAQQNFDRLQAMDLEKNLTPALLAYQGIQYQYMAPEVLETAQYEYLSKNLRILSGFYGVLRPFDGVTPYRLEMQSKLSVMDAKNLYAFWNKQIYEEVAADTDVILNLASKEYSKCVESFVTEASSFVTCVFGEVIDGKLIEKGTYAKMARGEMVRFLAQQQAETIEQVKEFNRLGFCYAQAFSSETTIAFVRSEETC